MKSVFAKVMLAGVAGFVIVAGSTSLRAEAQIALPNLQLTCTAAESNETVTILTYGESGDSEGVAKVVVSDADGSKQKFSGTFELDFLQNSRLPRKSLKIVAPQLQIKLTGIGTLNDTYTGTLVIGGQDGSHLEISCKPGVPVAQPPKPPVHCGRCSF